MIDWRRTQARLKAAGYDPKGIDGIPGANTYRALFQFCVGGGIKAADLSALGIGAAVHIPAAGIADDGMELAHFVGECAAESGFVHFHEIGGTAYFMRYEGRADLGNTQPGDGPRYHGRGILQATGRANYRNLGRLLGFDLEGNPDLAADPAMSVLVACRFWTDRKIGPIARADNCEGVAAKINGRNGATGKPNGMPARIKFTNRMKGLLL